MTIQAHTLAFLQEWLSKQGGLAQPHVTLLLGDGSTRRFYRVLDPGSSQSFILLTDPEWKQSKDYSPHQQALTRAQIPVPRFLKVDEKAGLILMEDLGDELLQNRMNREPDKKEFWLLQAVELLALLHGKLFPVPKDLPVCERSFDQAKYFEELSFTLEHLRKGYLDLPPLGTEQLEAIRKFCAEIGSFGPSVFCHRDYHCRNLLVHQDRLFMIDFQDARLGSPAYDLASLLFDAYTPISDGLRETLFIHYQNVLSNFPLGEQVNCSQLREELWKVAYQRTLKAAGSFASFWTRFKKNSHLEYLEPALKLSSFIEHSVEIPERVRSAFEIDRMLETLYAKQPHS